MIENIVNSNNLDNITSNCQTWGIPTTDTTEVIQNAEVVFAETLAPIESYISNNSLEVEVIDTKNNMEVGKMVDDKKKDLKLDFSNILPTTEATSIDTPEVIRAALSLRSEFNLLNFINNVSIMIFFNHITTYFYVVLCRKLTMYGAITVKNIGSKITFTK